MLSGRRAEADAFYDGVTPPGMSQDERQVVRQALAGMLWSKQRYGYDVERWLAEHGTDLAPGPILSDTLERAGPQAQQRAAGSLPMTNLRIRQTLLRDPSTPSTCSKTRTS